MPDDRPLKPDRFGPPSPWVLRCAPLVRPAGTVLDLACGGGRHARLFLARGNAVTAVDRDLAGVADLEGAPRFAAVAVDLEDGSPWPAGGPFDAVVVANYLHRPLFPAIMAAVAPGGVLIYETFAAGNERFGRPANPDFLLRPGELLDAVRGRLTVLAYEHGREDDPRPAVVQRLCAWRPDEADATVPVIPPPSGG
ncbi:MAG: class I SAM-dependent methyltransferase [Alphaproteobacteria bacterium]